MNQSKNQLQGKEGNQPLKKISYSELKIWNECAYKHKLIYKDKIKKFVGNEYTCFGTAIHYVCELLVQDKSLSIESAKLSFQKKFLTELQGISEAHTFNKELVQSMRSQGEGLVEFVLPELTKTFGPYELVSVEEPILEDITEFDTDYKFKGFIDLIIKTPDGKYHVIDWKTCSWGWRMDKKTDKITTYQLTLYKNYFSMKYNIEMSNIETHFALLKRTAKTNKVEIFKVSSGNRKTNNALELLKKALYNIESGLNIKNKTSCSNCEFYKTKHCR